jgi:hypothetical protein
MPTLMKVLSGAYSHPEYEGETWFDVRLLRFAGIRDSEARGIVTSNPAAARPRSAKKHGLGDNESVPSQLGAAM